MVKGVVKWFDDRKGYGFIIYGELQDIFVHYKEIIGEGHRTLQSGEYVEFRLVETINGLKAVNVSRVDYNI